MSLHVHIPTREEILPPGVTDGASLIEHYKRLRAQKYAPMARTIRRNVEPPPPPPVVEEFPEPEPDRLYTDLVLENQPTDIWDGFPRNTLSKIMQAVVSVSGVSRIDLISERRTLRIIRPRHTYFYLARTRSPYGLPTIGRKAGGRDHTTILSALRRVQRVLDANGLTVPEHLSHEDAARLILNADWGKRA